MRGGPMVIAGWDEGGLWERLKLIWPRRSAKGARMALAIWRCSLPWRLRSKLPELLKTAVFVFFAASAWTRLVPGIFVGRPGWGAGILFDLFFKIPGRFQYSEFLLL